MNINNIADIHCCNCLIKALNHHSGSACKFKWLASVIRRIKLCSIIKCSFIMNLYLLSHIRSFK